jgi:hypothetical protein
MPCKWYLPKGLPKKLTLINTTCDQKDELRMHEELLIKRCQSISKFDLKVLKEPMCRFFYNKRHGWEMIGAPRRRWCG